MPTLAPGDVFGDFRIESIAGRGGMGVVYRAVQLDLGRPVALKLIAADRAADPAFRERFQRESRLAALIDHPNVVPVHGAGEAEGQLYLVMRYVEGTDLHRHDVRVVDQRRQPRLALEALAEGRVGGAVGGDQLERDRAPEFELDGPVDDAHAAAPRDRFDAEITEDVTRSERCHAIHCDRAN